MELSQPLQTEAAEIVQLGQSKVHLTREIGSVLLEVLCLQLYSVKLQGSDKLFTQNFSFAEAPKNFTENPILSPEKALQDMVAFSANDISSLETDLKMLLGPITAFFE